MKIIGIAGTNGSGKDTVGQMLAERHNYFHVSTSDMIRELKRREFGDGEEGLVVRNDPFINKLRHELGPGFLIQKLYDEWLSKQEQYPAGVVASGIRAIGEAEKIHELGGRIIFVDADPRVRYQRVIGRARDKNEIGKSFDDFIAVEKLETDADPANKSVQNLAAMKSGADLLLENNGSDIEVFKNETETILAGWM